MNDLSIRIKEIRKEYKLTQEEFGKRIGLAKSSVSWVEKNKQGISDAVLKNIIKEFCINEPWLKYGIGEKYNEEKKKEKELLQNEYLLTNFLLKDDILSLLDKMKALGIEENMEIETSLQAVAWLLNYPIDKEKQLKYYEFLSSMLLDLQRFIELLQHLDANDEANANTLISKYAKSFNDAICNMTTLFLPDIKNSLVNISNTNNTIIAEKEVQDNNSKKPIILSADQQQKLEKLILEKRSEEPLLLTSSETELIKKIRTLSEKDKLKLEGYIDAKIPDQVLSSTLTSGEEAITSDEALA